MIAIAGIVRFDRSPPILPLLEPLLGRIAPDSLTESSTWTNERVGLGCCGLAGAGVAVRFTAEHALAFDGRLDNRDDLARALGLPNAATADETLVLAAYDAWGEDCAGRLLGDFAFALWDGRRQRLFCARDAVGGRPFFYVCTADLFAFASNDEALVGLPGVTGRPCEELAAFFLVRDFQDVRPEQTWVRDAQALLPAHALMVDREGVRAPRRYWRFEPAPPLRLCAGGELEVAFREVLAEATHCRLRGAREAAAMVSGGMDSATLMATLGRLAAAGSIGGVHAFSATADDTESSLESRCIHSLTAPSHVHPHFWRVPSLQGVVGLQDLKEAAWQHAHPIANAILIPAMMCLAARRAGRFQVLHAAAGDVAFGDYRRYIAALLRGGRWRAALRESRLAAVNNGYLRGQAPTSLLLRNAWTAFAPGAVQRAARRLRGSVGEAPAALTLLNPDFVSRLALPERIAARRQAIGKRSALDFKDAHARSVFGTHSRIAAGQVGCWRAASRYGVETSDPWADRRVLEFIARVPLDCLVRDGWTKHLARAAFAADLEDWVVWRNDKEHLGWAVAESLLRQSLDEVEAFVTSGVEAIGAIVDVAAVRSLHARCGGTPEPGDLPLFFDVMTLGLWAGRLTNPSPSAVAQNPTRGQPTPDSPAGV